MKKLQIFFVMLLLVFSACTARQIGVVPEDISKDEPPIKIGVMYPLTGDAAAYGLPIQKATQIAADEINTQGGINGKQIKFIFEDSKCNAKDANAAAQKLVNVDKVKVIIGGVCSSETLGAAPITEANKVILISPSSTSPDITNAGDFVFRVAPSDSFSGIVASEFAKNNLKATKAALITESSDYAQGLRVVFKENFAKLGGTIVADETYNPEDTDFRTQAAKVKAANADVIYIVPQTPAKSVLLAKQIKEAGIKKQLLTAEVLIGRNLVKENADALEGIIGIEQSFNDNAPKTAVLLTKYKERAKEDAPIPTFMAGAYDVVYLVADAIAKNGENAEKIRDQLYSVRNFDGAVGKITFDKNGDVILGFSVKQVRNGELVTLK